MSEFRLSKPELPETERNRFFDALAIHLPVLRPNVIPGESIAALVKEFFPNTTQADIEELSEERVTFHASADHELDGFSVSLTFMDGEHGRAGSVMLAKTIREQNLSFVFFRYYALNSNGDYVSKVLGRALDNHETEEISEPDLRLMVSEPSERIEMALLELGSKLNARRKLEVTDIDDAVELLGKLNDDTKIDLGI